MANRYRRRKAIEIYFVLYLSALILILPGKKSDIAIQNGSVDLTLFALQAQKQELACRFVVDSAGPRITFFDSVNVISYAGAVEDVRYEFIIEDKTTNEKFRLANDQKTDINQFSLEDYPDRRQAIFKWNRPNLKKQNKSFTVKVTAYANIIDPNNGDQHQPITAKTQFSLNLLYEGEFINGSFQAAPQPLTLSQPNFTNGQPAVIDYTNAEFALEPRYKVLQALPLQRWQNTIILFGANPNYDLKENPKIKISKSVQNTGNAEIISYDERSVNVGGIAPESGEMKVLFSAIRKKDNKEITIEFKVRSQKVSKPECDTIMFADENYLINPNLPFINSQETKAILKDEFKTYNISQDGSSFNYVPDKSLIGKTIYLERYFGDNLVDRTPIRIKSYPKPEIIAFYLEAGKAYAKVKSWKKAQGRENFANIEIVEGSAIIQDLYGKTQKSGNYIIQTFELQLNDKKAIIIRAIDKMGGKSDIKKLN